MAADERRVWVASRKTEKTRRAESAVKARFDVRIRDAEAAGAPPAELDAIRAACDSELDRIDRNAKKTYHLRWIDPTEKRWKSKAAGTSDHKKAMGRAAKLEAELATGSYAETRRIAWGAFVDEHVATMPGKANAEIARRTLTEFAKECAIASPRSVTFASIERYAAFCRKQDRTQATTNKCLRYIRAAMNKAVRRKYLATSPMVGWQWSRPNEKAVRIVSDKEEGLLLAKAEARYGQRFKAFLQVSLGTGGRRGELLGLTWDRIDLEEKTVTFTATKGKRDRRIPILDELVPVFTRVRAQAQQDAGPFSSWNGNVATKMFDQVADDAGITDVCLHDLRRTCITRLIRADVSLPTVQKLAGHASITTTLWYYNQVNDEDLRAGLAKLSRSQSCYRPATEPKIDVS